MAQWLRALADLPEGLGAGANTHMALTADLVPSPDILLLTYNT